MVEEQERYADKIAKLLRKAESTTAEEAELLTAKAMELMTLYAIDEQMLARAAGRQVQEELTRGVIEYTGIFMATLMDIGFAVARFNNCRSYFSKVEHTKPKRHDLHVFGFKGDVDATVLLSQSLEIQCMRALAQWRQTSGEADFSKMESFKQRRQFIVGFVHGLTSKLHEARKAGIDAATKSEAERSKVAADQASTSVALVLRSRKQQVDDWFDGTYGRGLRKVTRNYSSGGRGAHDAGVSAGRAADVGQPGVGGTRGSIGKGS